MSVGVYTIYYIHFAFVVKYTEETFHKIKLHLPDRGRCKNDGNMQTV